VDRYSFGVELFHLLLQAGLSRRTPFGPPPLQELHRYYEPVRQPNPQRYSHPRQAQAAPSRPPETPTSSVGFGLLPFHAEAADRARVASMPDTAWPINGHPPDSSRDSVDTPVSMSPVFISTRQQRFARARLPDPHLTRHTRLFHIAHHGRVTTPAACGGLKPPPAGRLRRADNPSSPAQHRFTKLYLHRAPFHVRDTPTDILSDNRQVLVDASVAKPTIGPGSAGSCGRLAVGQDPPDPARASSTNSKTRRSWSPDIHASRTSLGAISVIGIHATSARW
jgi:hypothetical protein